MAFHDVSFPLPVGFGASGGPERRTRIISLASGYERRSTPWAQSRRRYDAGPGLRSVADIERVIAFFEARAGRLHGFRFRDPLDWRSAPVGAAITPLDQSIGAGDGETSVFQLTKRLGDLHGGVDRPIRTPVANTVRIAVDGVEDLDASVDALTGLASLISPPPAGAVVTAGYEFDTPVRFDTDALVINLPAFEAGDIPAIPLIEIRI